MSSPDQHAAKRSEKIQRSEGQGAHPWTPSQSDAIARPEATLPDPGSSTAARASVLTYSPRLLDEGYDGWCSFCGVNPVYGPGLCSSCQADEDFENCPYCHGTSCTQQCEEDEYDHA